MAIQGKLTRFSSSAELTVIPVTYLAGLPTLLQCSLQHKESSKVQQDRPKVDLRRYCFAMDRLS